MKEEKIIPTTHRSKSSMQNCNHTIYKCKKQRNNYIKREVNDLIKKELCIFFATKKLEKQLEEHQKDIVFTTPPTPMQRVQGFRVKQREKQIEKLRHFKVKNQERMKRLALKLKEKSLNNRTKSSQNFMKMSKIHKQYEHIQQTNTQRIQQLKKYLMTSTPRPSIRNNSSMIVTDEKIMEKVYKARQQTMNKQNKNINNFLTKMKILEQRNVKKQFDIQTKKLQATKNTAKCNIALRTHKQQNMINSWNAEYEKRFERFEKNRKIYTRQKQQLIYERSVQKQNIKQQILQRKHQQQQEMAQKRMQSLQQKLNKIKQCTLRNDDTLFKSRTNFMHNSNKFKEDNEKQQHSQIMRKVYQIIERLKKLEDFEQLKQSQIDLLLENLDKNDGDYKEICNYLSLTKQKYLQQKRKEEQQRIKKNKKLNQKVL